MIEFLGKGKSLQNPGISVTEKDETAIDFYGREFTIPAGSTVRHFETINKGWLVWKEPDGKSRIRDLG